MVGWNSLLKVDLGTRVCRDQVGQAPGERGVALVDTSSALAYYAVELVWVMGHVQTLLAALTLEHVGEMLVARAAAGCVSIRGDRPEL